MAGLFATIPDERLAKRYSGDLLESDESVEEGLTERGGMRRTPPRK
jgi:hypothetical protein